MNSVCVCDSNGSVMFNIANCRCLSVTNFVYTFVYREISHEIEISPSVNLLILTVPRKTLNGQKIESAGQSRGKFTKYHNSNQVRGKDAN